MTEIPVTARIAIIAADTSFTVDACIGCTSLVLSGPSPHHEHRTQKCQYCHGTDACVKHDAAIASVIATVGGIFGRLGLITYGVDGQVVRVEGYDAVLIGDVGGIGLLSVVVDPLNLQFLSVLESDVTGD